MKSINYSIFVFLLSINSILAQEPLGITWTDIQPKWSHVSVNDHFNYDAEFPYLNKYGSMVPNDFRYYEGNIYILESTFTKPSDLGLDGVSLSKLNAIDGHKQWNYTSGESTGDQYREYYHQTKLYFDTENDLVRFAGFRSSEPRGSHFFPILGYDGFPVIRKLDLHTGGLQDSIQVNQSNATKLVDNFDRFHQLDNGIFINSSHDLEADADTLKVLYNFNNYRIQNNTIKSSESRYDSKIGLESQSFYLPEKQVLDLNNNSLVSIDVINNPANSSTIAAANISYYKLDEEALGLVLDKKIDVKEHIYTPQDMAYAFNFVSNNEDVIIWQTMLPFGESPFPVSFFTWLSWFDQNGNLKGKVYGLHTDDIYYQTLQIIEASATKLLLTARYAGSNYNYIDILEIEAGTNIVTKKGRITMDALEGVDYKFQKSILGDNNLLYISCRIEDNRTDKTKSYNHYYAFDAQELGIVSSSKDELVENSVMDIYPNPASDKLSISMPEGMGENVKLQISNMAGMNQKVKMVNDQISVQHLAPGMYILNVIAQSGKTMSGKFVKQ